MHCTHTRGSHVNSNRNIPDCGRCLDSGWWFNVCRSCQANSRPHIMIVFSPDHKEVRDARHVWPAKLRVSFIQQHRFPSAYILYELSLPKLFWPFLYHLNQILHNLHFRWTSTQLPFKCRFLLCLTFSLSEHYLVKAKIGSRFEDVRGNMG